MKQLLLKEAEKRNLTSRLNKIECYQDYLKATLPKGWTADAPHIRAICEALDAIDKGEIDRLAIHMPPRHGKTETVSVRYGAYCMEKMPYDNTLITSASERLARRFSRKTRNIVSERVKLDEARLSVDEWGTRQGGTFMARGVGAPPTGVGFKRIIIDDPIRKREDAESESYRDKAWDWYTDDLYTRLEPKGAIVLVCTLWHHDDVAHRAVSSEPNRWHVLKLPALAETGDALNREYGDALWPERFSKEELNRIKEVLIQNEGDYGWQSLYQQNPTPREGALFKINAIQISSELPRMVRLIRSWDLASVAGRGDYTVGILAGLDVHNKFWILDMVRGQYDVDKRDDLIERTAAEDGNKVIIRLPQDPAQAGRSQIRYLTRRLHGYQISVQSPSGSKALRASPLISQANSGNVYMAKNNWNNDVISEMRTFPVGKNDDIVDALADAYDEATRRRKLTAV